MHLHLLGIAGTFMSGVAVLAKALGFRVSGSDMNIYPPMSTQLQAQGIALFQGYTLNHLPQDIDCFIVGNVIKRGNEIIEHILANQIPYQSGPSWLYEAVLQKRHVIAVSGTHGKTTTTSLISWILSYADFKPGFLIGGIPENFGVSAQLGESSYFVIEADEYDSAFFDKRSKFIHYHPKTLIINNLEYDHADIFPDLAAIQTQFHHLLKTIPNNGLIIHPADDGNVTEVMNRGCFTPTTTFGLQKGDWQARLLKEDGSHFAVSYRGKCLGEITWSLLGHHNVSNAIAAFVAATQVGVAPDVIIQAAAHFKNVKRRLEVKGNIKGVTLYDDFAHHPTAIETTLKGLRAKVGNQSRIIVILEFGSFTMKTGVHKEAIKKALRDADMVVCKSPPLDWGLQDTLAEFPQPTALFSDVATLVAKTVPELKNADHVVVMSNSGFDNIHEKLIQALQS